MIIAHLDTSGEAMNALTACIRACDHHQPNWMHTCIGNLVICSVDYACLRCYFDGRG